MSNKSFGKNLFVVVFSRIISLVSGVVVGFVLPKVLSITDYGFYKIFTLYAVYTALLHFGFVDGILLKLSGKKYEELEVRRMRTLTRFFIFSELLVSVIILLVGCIIARGEYLFLVIMLAVNMVFVNVTTYYQFISQAVQRFAEYSAKNIAISIVKLIFVLILWVLDANNVVGVSYRTYLIGLNIIDFSIMMWYLAIYRNITWGKCESTTTVKNDIISIFKTGIILTLAYQVSHLILALDRQFVNLLFSTEVFAVYSFAYNIVSVISTMVSSVSIVLLPMLKNRSHEAVINAYRKCLSTVTVIASWSLLCFFPLVLFIEWFLPEYVASSEYIAIVLPAFIFTSSITVVMFTIYKILELNSVFFRDGCLILALGFLLNVVAYYFFKTPNAISYASLIVTMIWFLMSGIRLKKKTNVGVGKDFLYLSVVAVGFLLIVNYIANIFVGFVAYLAWLTVWTIVFRKDVIRETIDLLKARLIHDRSDRNI